MTQPLVTGTMAPLVSTLTPPDTPFSFFPPHSMLSLYVLSVAVWMWSQAATPPAPTWHSGALLPQVGTACSAHTHT